MKRMPVSKMTDEQLVERFLYIALEQDQANLYGEHGRYNRLFDLMEDIEDELKCRDGDRRSLLMPLYKHDVLQVQLKAALATLAIALKAARAVLQRLSDRNRYPEAASAREMLDALDDGSYVPT